MLAANLAADLDSWVRLLALHNIDGLADAEPDTMLPQPSAGRYPHPSPPPAGSG
jgi:hypothetical protein